MVVEQGEGYSRRANNARGRVKLGGWDGLCESNLVNRESMGLPVDHESTTSPPRVHQGRGKAGTGTSANEEVKGGGGDSRNALAGNDRVPTDKDV